MDEQRRAEVLRALKQWEVPFLSSPALRDGKPPLTSCELLRALIESDSERLKLALIAFFLRHPERAADVHTVLPYLEQHRHQLLKCYYMAAVYLQVLWQGALLTPQQPLLPDYFSAALGLPLPTVVQSHMGLAALEEKFQETTGWQYNYRSSFDALVRLLAAERMYEATGSR